MKEAKLTSILETSPMKFRMSLVAVTSLALASISFAEQFSIPEQQVDRQRIFFGKPDGFENPAEVELKEILQNTPAYRELKRSKTKKGTAKYIVLLGQATGQSIRAIVSYSKKTGYDLVAAKGYLGRLNPPIPSEDVTKQVIEMMDLPKSDGRSSKSS